MRCTHDGIYFCCAVCMCPGLSQYDFKIKYLPKKLIFFPCVSSGFEMFLFFYLP